MCRGVEKQSVVTPCSLQILLSTSCRTLSSNRKLPVACSEKYLQTQSPQCVVLSSTHFQFHTQLHELLFHWMVIMWIHDVTKKLSMRQCIAMLHLQEDDQACLGLRQHVQNWKLSHVVFELCEWTDRQTDRNILITILCRDKVTKHVDEVKRQLVVDKNGVILRRRAVKVDDILWRQRRCKQLMEVVDVEETLQHGTRTLRVHELNTATDWCCYSFRHQNLGCFRVRPSPKSRFFRCNLQFSDSAVCYNYKVELFKRMFLSITEIRSLWSSVTMSKITST